MVYFKDRTHAGRLLAHELSEYAIDPPVLVLGLPRGGVPLAFEVARALHAPLDVLIVRKLGLPGHEELAMGALSSGGGQVLNPQVIAAFDVDAAAIEAVANAERHEIERREQLYRGGRGPLEVKDKTVLLIDDGLATGSTMLAGIRALRHLQPRRLIAAAPVAPRDALRELSPYVDELVVLFTPENFYAVGQWYQYFDQTTDQEVTDLLLEAQTFSSGNATSTAASWSIAP